LGDRLFGDGRAPPPPPAAAGNGARPAPSPEDDSPTLMIPIESASEAGELEGAYLREESH
jgi:hypothetical protein